MIRYQISTGELKRDDGTQIGTGYSGQPECKNDPDSCSVHDKGPIPPGRYTIEQPHNSPTHGPFAMHLTPDPGNEMFGRSAFMIHGDSVEHPGKASNGCIIAPRIVRETIHNLGEADPADKLLEVVP